MQGERSSNQETKKSKAARGGTRQSYVSQIENQEAEEEIRDAMTFGDAVLSVLGLKKEEEN